MNYSELYDFVEKDGVDGFFVFYTAVLNGMDVQRMPGQLFLISNHRTPDSKTSFVHSVAQSTRLSTTTFVLQKRFRRVLFQQAKVPMPKAATFSFFSYKDPVKYANKIGYPVVVKEMFGENPSFSIYNVRNKKELFAGIEKVRQHLPVNSERTPSSYAQTINLGSAESIDDNTRVKSNKSRFIVEKQLDGDVYRAYVVGGKVHSVLKPSGNGFVKINSPAKNVIDVAESSINAVPGIINAAIDIVQVGNDSAYLVEFSERLLPVNEISNEAEFNLMGDIYSSVLSNEALLARCELSSLKKSARYKLSLGGISNIEDFLNSLAGELSLARLSSKIISKNDIEGSIDLEVKGSAFKLVMLLERICNILNVSYVSVKRKRLSR